MNSNIKIYIDNRLKLSLIFQLNYLTESLLRWIEFVIEISLNNDSNISIYEQNMYDTFIYDIFYLRLCIIFKRIYLSVVLL